MEALRVKEFYEAWKYNEVSCREMEVILNMKSDQKYASEAILKVNRAEAMHSSFDASLISDCLKNRLSPGSEFVF